MLMIPTYDDAHHDEKAGLGEDVVQLGGHVEP